MRIRGPRGVRMVIAPSSTPQQSYFCQLELYFDQMLGLKIIYIPTTPTGEIDRRTEVLTYPESFDISF